MYDLAISPGEALVAPLSPPITVAAAAAAAVAEVVEGAEGAPDVIKGNDN